MSASEPSELPPFMGFDEEQYVPEHKTRRENYDKSINMVAFYHCICNGKRVFIWAWTPTSQTCFMLVRSWEHAERGWKPREIQTWFADTFVNPNYNGPRDKHNAPSEPLLLQAFIHHITSGGNNI